MHQPYFTDEETDCPERGLPKVTQLSERHSWIWTQDFLIQGPVFFTHTQAGEARVKEKKEGKKLNMKNEG